MIWNNKKILEKGRWYGNCECGGKIVLDTVHREFVCIKCGKIYDKPRGRGLIPTRYMITVCPNCQSNKRKPRKVMIVEYNHSGYGYCPLCGYKYKFD